MRDQAGLRWDGHRRASTCASASTSPACRHWRASSLTSDPQRDGRLHLDHGQARRRRARSRRTSSGAGGRARSSAWRRRGRLRPARRDPRPKLLFVSAGSGITPIMSDAAQPRHQRDDEGRRAAPLRPPRADSSSSAAELRDMEKAARGFKLPRAAHSATTVRMGPADLDKLCPDWTRARGVRVGAGATCSKPSTDHWDGARRLRPPAHGALPARPRRRTSRRARAARSSSRLVRLQDRNATARRRSSSPANRPALERPDGRREGDLPHVCRNARDRGSPTRPSQRRQISQQRGRTRPHLHQRA